MATSSTETIAPKLSPCWPTGDATEAGDAELAGHVKGRDRAAEAELVCRLAPRVWPYGLRHLRDLTADDDLVQARTRMR